MWEANTTLVYAYIFQEILSIVYQIIIVILESREGKNEEGGHFKFSWKKVDFVISETFESNPTFLFKGCQQISFRCV